MIYYLAANLIDFNSLLLDYATIRDTVLPVVAIIATIMIAIFVLKSIG